jgi:hypothetical protein
VRFALAEYPADCAIGANSEGLYISSSIDALKNKRWWWSGGYMVKTPIFIPWNCLRYGGSTFPLRGYIRFDVPSLKIGFSTIAFFIPRETGQLLLKRVERQISAG